jgi:LacI family transcriptional regulator
VCINDLTAFGALRAAHTLGITVPEDISLVGVDDIMMSDIVTPPLTTVRMSRSQLAQRCMESFEAMTSNPDGMGKQLWVKLELVVRSSTAAPRRNVIKAKLRR